MLIAPIPRSMPWPGVAQQAFADNVGAVRRLLPAEGAVRWCNFAARSRYQQIGPQPEPLGASMPRNAPRQKGVLSVARASR